MNINRHNYEEYFILYMDNELSSDDRRMVEAFIVQHPDLKEELELLQQFKLEPDTAITYNGKEELMKLNGEDILGALQPVHYHGCPQLTSSKSRLTAGNDNKKR